MTLDEAVDKVLRKAKAGDGTFRIRRPAFGDDLRMPTAVCERLVSEKRAVPLAPKMGPDIKLLDD